MDLSVTLPVPLGIVFEEIEPGSNKGVIVASLIPGGNADKDGRVLVGDKVDIFAHLFSTGVLSDRLDV